jgi:hypothetical protein
MDAQDVKRIVRDVVNTHAVDVSVLSAELTENGWRITLADAAGRILTRDLEGSSPAAIRAAVAAWLDAEP